MRLISDDTNALFWDSDPKEPIGRLIEGLFADYDLVLVEGCSSRWGKGPLPPRRSEEVVDFIEERFL